MANHKMVTMVMFIVFTVLFVFKVGPKVIIRELMCSDNALTLQNCRTTPHEYSDIVDFRIIILVYNRDASFQFLLNSLQYMQIPRGDKAVMEIWIDPHPHGPVSIKTYDTAIHYKWKNGDVRVHVHDNHVGFLGQWIDTWRPNPSSSEIVLYIEDDVSVSKYAYMWLKCLDFHCVVT